MGFFPAAEFIDQFGHQRIVRSTGDQCCQGGLVVNEDYHLRVLRVGEEFGHSHNRCQSFEFIDDRLLVIPVELPDLCSIKGFAEEGLDCPMRIINYTP